MVTFAINPFARRQVEDSRFSHFNGSDQELLNLVAAAYEQAGRPTDNVVVLTVTPDKFMTGQALAEPGMKLEARFESRRPGEAPRYHIGRVVGQDADSGYAKAKTPALAVNVVLYASDLLAKDGDNSCPPGQGCYEVISINARPTLEEEPISPEALIANHLGESGGTDHGLTDAEFVSALRASRAYHAKYISLA
jgi:hypothetical protein